MKADLRISFKEYDRIESLKVLLVRPPLTQTSYLAPAALGLRTESRASVLAAPVWRDFSQMRRGQEACNQAAWVGMHQVSCGKGVKA